METKDERAFYPGFLESLSVPELVGLQHELRRSPEDRLYLNQVLEEFRRRAALSGGAQAHDGPAPGEQT